MLRKEAQPLRMNRKTAGVRWRFALLAAVLVPLLVPVAGHAATWHTEANAPASVHFFDVAAGTSASGPVVVAVGQDGANGVIYRLSRGSWKADVVPPTTGLLTEVAFVGAGAQVYALGPEALLRLDGADADGAATWNAVSGRPAGLTALAFAPDGSSGFVGTDDGHIYTHVPGGQDFTPVNDVQGHVTPPAGEVAGLTSTAPGAGFAVTLGASNFLALSSSSYPQPQAAFEPVGGADCGALRGVAASGATAVAVSEACWWNLVDGAWRGHAQAGVLKDIALSGSGAGATTAIAGEAAGDGAVWHRAGSAGFVFDGAVAPDALEAVAVLAADNMWAVGASGTVRHYFTDPPPPPKEDGSVDKPGPGGEPSDEERTPNDLQIVIDDGGKRKKGGDPEHSTTGIETGSGGKKKPAHKPAKTKRLLRNVSVRATKRGLVIEFDLVAPAKVAVAALRGKRSIGSTTSRVLKPGHRRIVLRYRGAKPPTSLRITARRSTKTGAPARPAPGKK